MPRTKSSNSIDKHVGSRIRMRREMLTMSQTKLGNALGIHFSRFTNTRRARTQLVRAGCIISLKSYRSRRRFFSRTRRTYLRRRLKALPPRRSRSRISWQHRKGWPWRRRS